MRFHDVLNGWAEIAATLGCSIRTAQRWARAGRLAVNRFPGTIRSRVYAHRSEINASKERSRIPWRIAPECRGPETEAPTHALIPHEQLWGWKAIARFMAMSVRSVQRWESEAKLPVHRLKTGHRARPYALKAQLWAWIVERTVSRRPVPQLDMTRQRLPALLQPFLDRLTASVAVLDETGTIIVVNEAWRAFGKANGYREPNFGVGTNCFEVFRSATYRHAKTASSIADGLVELLAGKRRELVAKWRYDSPTGERDCLLWATRFENAASPFLVITHSDVTSVL